MFLDNMATAARQVAVLYLLVAVGFAVDRLHIFGQDTAKASNNFLFYIITPAVIVQSFMSMEFSLQTAGRFALAFVLMVSTITVGIFLAVPFFKKSGENANVFKYAVSYGNMGYMGLPLCQAILGSEGVFYCSAGVVAFNIISFTHGIALMTRGTDKKGFEPKKLIFNPGVISVLIGLPLFVFGVRLPDIIQTPINHIASLNTPLAMIFLGTYIANSDLKEMFKIKENYLVMLLKLVVLPLCMLGIFKLFGISGSLLTACIISASVPSATNTVMFAAKYGKNTSTASETVALSSVVSVLTMPVMIALSRL